MTRKTNIDYRMNIEKRAYQSEIEAKGHREYFNFGKKYITKIILEKIKEFADSRENKEYKKIIYKLYKNIKEMCANY